MPSRICSACYQICQEQLPACRRLLVKKQNLFIEAHQNTIMPVEY